MKATVLLLAAILLLVSCNNQSHVPGDVIPQEKMKLIVWDLLRGDEYQKSFAPADTVNLINQRIRRQEAAVFAFHGITAKDFFHSYRYYQSHPPLQKALYDSLAAMAARKPRPLLPAIPSKS